MAIRGWLGAGALPLLGLTACPVTDDYYLLPTASAPAQAGETGSAGSQAISVSGNGAGGIVAGSPADEGGATGAGGAGSSLADCQNFALESEPGRSYLYCGGAKTWNDARDDCLGRGMRLLWLESAAENAAISGKLAELGDDAEVSTGANDQSVEGQWRWGPGDAFWQGDHSGNAVAQAFTSWDEGAPNDLDGGEDCGVLYPDLATWGDKACELLRPYVCEPSA